MRKLICLSLAIAAVVLHGVEARAASMNVTYTLSGVAIVPVVGVISNLTGSMNVVYTATGGTVSGPNGNVPHGPAVIAGGTLMAPFNFTVFGQGGFVGSAQGPIGEAGLGALSSGAGNLTLPFAGTLTGMIHCTDILPGFCAGQGFPTSVPVPITLGPAGTLNGPLVGAVSGMILPTIAFSPALLGTFQSFPILATLTATEVSRHYRAQAVPEPGTMPLMAIGLVLFGIAGRQMVRCR